MNNNITHPKHYTSHPSGVECIEITRHHNFNIGNAIKYLWRAGIKQEQGKSDKEKEIEDLQKAVWYIQDYINQLTVDELLTDNDKEEILSYNKSKHCNCNCSCNNKLDNQIKDLRQEEDKADKGHYIGLDREK